ncbi:MAG: hypothetical protein FJX46_17160 [Alphaproteobacteria bacterium]|nr:hypothetical protein [Alphaproteobacteria bacterium]
MTGRDTPTEYASYDELIRWLQLRRCVRVEVSSGREIWKTPKGDPFNLPPIANRTQSGAPLVDKYQGTFCRQHVIGLMSGKRDYPPPKGKVLAVKRKDES